MPWDDWQFWVVTLMGLVGLLVIVKQLVPGRKTRAKRVSLTLDGERVEQHRG